MPAVAAVTSPLPAAASSGGRQVTARAPSATGSGKPLQGFDDGTIELFSGAADRSTPQIMMLPSRATVQALGYSPEGVYLAAVSRGQVFFVDTAQAVVVRTADLPGANGFVADNITFSPNGRWLAVGGRRDGQSAQAVLAVSTGKVLWDKPGTSIEFDRAQALANVRQASGAGERLELR